MRDKRLVFVNKADKQMVKLKLTPNLVNIHDIKVGLVTFFFVKAKIKSSILFLAKYFIIFITQRKCDQVAGHNTSKQNIA